MSGPIVVPLDGSSAAEHALAAAISIARQFQADIHLLIVGSANHGELDGIAASIERRLDAERVILATFDHDIARSIGDYARDITARMIVLGSRPQSDAPLARVTDALTRRAGVPVLLVPDDGAQPAVNGWRCQRIMVPLDGSVLAEQIMPPVTALAARYAARITLLRVLPEVARAPWQESEPMSAPLAPAGRQREALAELETIARLLRASGLSVNTRVFETALPPAVAIRQQARAQKIDMIALASRGYGVARQFAFGSVARELVNAADIPLFVLLPRERAARAGNTRVYAPPLQPA